MSQYASRYLLEVAGALLGTILPDGTDPSARRLKWVYGDSPDGHHASSAELWPVDNVKFDLWRKRVQGGEEIWVLSVTPYVATLLRPYGPRDLTHCALWITTIMKL